MRGPGILAVAVFTLLGATASAWQSVVNGPASGDDTALAVAVDRAGDAAAAGFVTSAGNGTDFAVVALAAADGSSRWPAMVTIDGSAHMDDQANAVATDAAGNVVAAGFLANTGSGHDFFVVKLDRADGHELWRYTLAGTTAGDDGALAVAVDGAGDVIAAGFTLNAGTGLDLTVVKLRGTDGALAWPAAVAIDGDDHGGDVANALALDAAGNAVAGGFTHNFGALANSDFTVVKLAAADGHALWRRVLDGSSSSTDVVDAVAVDGAGNVAAAGFMTNAGDIDFAVVKLNGADGTLLWPAPVAIDGTGTDFGDTARAVAVDGNGDVVAAGLVDNTGTDPERGLDFTVAKLRAADGGELWRHPVKGTGGSSLSDDGFAIAVDTAGQIVAGGLVENAGTGQDFTVVRLSRADGSELFRRTSNGSATTSADRARAVVVDAAGNVVAAGRIDNAGTGKDFAVLKLGCTGGEPVPCGDPATCYDRSTCDPSAPACTTSADGTACDDGDACTRDDTCQAGRCVPNDAAAVGCELAAGLAHPACAADRLPRGVKRGLRKARMLAFHAGFVSDAGRANGLYRRARKRLDRVPGAIDKATRRGRRPLSAACADALRAIVRDGQQRLDRLAM